VRCKACDKIMSNYELTKKFDGSGEFVDLCNECSRFLADDDITTVGNVDYADLYDLEEIRDVEDEPLDYYPTPDTGDADEWS
jgi:hypothetical protein